MKEKLTITIDPQILVAIDNARGLIPRSTFIEHQLRKALGMPHGLKNPKGE